MEYVVKPRVVRLPLSNGQFIDVKRRLNAGEEQDMMASMSPTTVAGETPLVNTKTVMTAKPLAYLLAWSITNDGIPVPMNPEMPEAARLSSLRSLDPIVFSEIRKAIDTHQDAVEEEIEASKNGQGGGTELSATSPSPDITAGVMSGSTN